MKILCKTLLYAVLSITTGNCTYGQFVDNVGLRMGAGFANQYWEYKDVHFTDQSGWQASRPGFAAYLNVEKSLNSVLILRPELGYNQKGFKNNTVVTDQLGQVIELENNDVVLHNLSLNLSVKAKPFENRVHPYFILGLRGDYMLAFKDVEYEQNGAKAGLYESYLNDYNKFVLSGIFGVGISFRDILFFDAEYNPALTKNFKNDAAEIHDKYFLISIGFNLNKIYLL